MPAYKVVSRTRFSENTKWCRYVEGKLLELGSIPRQVRTRLETPVWLCAQWNRQVGKYLSPKRVTVSSACSSFAEAPPRFQFLEVHVVDCLDLDGLGPSYCPVKGSLTCSFIKPSYIHGWDRGHSANRWWILNWMLLSHFPVSSVFHILEGRNSCIDYIIFN